MISSTFSKLRRTLSVRKKKNKPQETNQANKPAEWLSDEENIKNGFCSFLVKYLGSIEVFESRGVQVCELAIKALNKKKGIRFFRKRGQRAILTVTGDELKVSDEVSKHLLVDQTIEKVSFCAPDRFNPNGFAYICRDGATRRWMCHAFLAVNETGERLSHAVGCAFNICLEKKQKREKEAVTVTFNENKTSFTRNGTFRQTTLAERLADPQMVLNTPAAASTPLAIEFPVTGSELIRNNTLTSSSRPRPHGQFKSMRFPKNEPILNFRSSVRQELPLAIINETSGNETGDLLSTLNYSPMNQFVESKGINVNNKENQLPSTEPVAPSDNPTVNNDPFSSAPIDIQSLNKWQMNYKNQPITLVNNSQRINALDTICHNNTSDKIELNPMDGHLLMTMSKVEEDPFDLNWCESIDDTTIRNVSLTSNLSPANPVKSNNPFVLM